MPSATSWSGEGACRDGARKKNKAKKGGPLTNHTCDVYTICMIFGSRTNEFQRTNFTSFSGGQISITFPDTDDLTQVSLCLRPNDGPYRDGTFHFTIKLPPDYPKAKAQATCDTKIFHPNIDYSGNICFNLFKGSLASPSFPPSVTWLIRGGSTDEWNSDVRLVDYAHGLLWLLYYPNLHSRLNGHCPEDEAEFVSLVRQSLRGSARGVRFPVMIYDPSRMTVAQMVSMFNAGAATPPPPPDPHFYLPATPPPPPMTSAEIAPAVHDQAANCSRA